MDDFLGTASQHSEEQIKRLEQEYAMYMEQTAQGLIASGFLDSDYDGSSGELSDTPSTEYSDSDNDDEDDCLAHNASAKQLYDFSVESTEHIVEPIGNDARKQDNQYSDRIVSKATGDNVTRSLSATSPDEADSKTESDGDINSELYADHDFSSECEEIEENVPWLVYKLSSCSYDEDRKNTEEDEVDDDVLKVKQLQIDDTCCYNLKYMYFDEEDKENHGKMEEAIFEAIKSEIVQLEHKNKLIVIDCGDKIYEIINAYSE